MNEKEKKGTMYLLRRPTLMSDFRLAASPADHSTLLYPVFTVLGQLGAECG